MHPPFDTRPLPHYGPDGEVVLAWSYRVIRLWEMRAEDILALGRRSMLPLVALTRVEHPAETLAKVIAEIRAEPEEQQQTRLLAQLIGLLKDEELTAMIEHMLSDIDLEELREFPNLWKSYQKVTQRAKEEGERQRACDDILEVVTTRFNPPAADYRRVEKALAAIGDTARLSDLFTCSLRAAAFAEFEAGLAE